MNSIRGFSLLSALIAVSLLSVALLVYFQGKSQYSQTRATMVHDSLFREVRSSIINKVIHHTHLFFSKRCISRTPGPVIISTAPSHPRYNDIFSSMVYAMDARAKLARGIASIPITDAIKFFSPTPASLPPIPSNLLGLRLFFESTFNDLFIQSSFGGLTGLGRPAEFWPASNPAPTNDLEKALQRCAGSQTNIHPTASTFYGCYEIVARQELAFDISGYSIMKAENGLVEFRLEFSDAGSGSPLQCQQIPYIDHGVVTAKTVLYWGAANDVRTITDVFTFNR